VELWIPGSVQCRIWRVRSARAVTREGRYQGSARPDTSADGVPGNASGPSSAVKT
jgi:hypothetical protein